MPAPIVTLMTLAVSWRASIARTSPDSASAVTRGTVPHLFARHSACVKRCGVVSQGAHSMAIASLKDLYFDELADLYDAETQILRTLPRLVEAARSPDLREALKKHWEESRLHLERLELIFTHWGERRRSKA